MPSRLPRVIIPQARDVEELRKNLEHQINITITRLNKTADHLTFPMDAQNHPITNLPNPSQQHDAATKQYVDDAIAALAAKLGVNLL